MWLCLVSDNHHGKVEYHLTLRKRGIDKEKVGGERGGKGRQREGGRGGRGRGEGEAEGGGKGRQREGGRGGRGRGEGEAEGGKRVEEFILIITQY